MSSDPVLRELLIQSVRCELGLAADDETPRLLKAEQAAKVAGISYRKALDLIKRGEFPGQLTRERPIRISTYALIQALLGDDDRVAAPDDGSPGLVVQQGSQTFNGKSEREPLSPKGLR